MITPKAINLNINFERSAPLYCEFLRGDSIQFNLTFNDTYNASKMRVLCYMRSGQYAFGNEFSDLTKAVFFTNYTAGYSGQATITIQLLDDEENLINSANIACKIIESHTQTPFISSPDFAEKSRTEISEIVNSGKAEIQESISNAKDEIDNWSDQTSRFAKNESDIADLFLSKTNSSVLHIGGSGSSIVCANNDGMPAEFTWCRTIKMNWADWEAVSANAYIDGTNLGFGASSTLGAAFTKRSTNALGFIYRNASGTAVNYNLTPKETQNLFNGKTHTLCLCVSNGVFQFYVDNKKTSTSSTGSTSSIAQTYNAPKIRNIKAELSRVYNFNFDISDANAPYTLEDYQFGKSIPPSLKSGGQVSLALEDYTITNGTTKMIFDVSGNNNDATITGNVSGDKDVNIQRLVDFIKA